jgi:hypothetical protein
MKKIQIDKSNTLGFLNIIWLFLGPFQLYPLLILYET